ncbi:MAG: 30S ribosomal protein S17 [Myxococcales bacterium]|jgi:small subunit ribosomal protein S17|nr:30S ribosomal protein S17 [Myxococcales bacterium]
MTAAEPGQPTPKATKERGRRRRLVGRVVNETQTEGRVQQTVVVEVIRRARDPFYGKYVKRKKKFHAHDEANEYRKNDVVEIRACRPRSKTKRWEVVRLIERPPEV